MEQLVSSAFLPDILQTNENVVLKFWAEWCGPCKMFSPVMDEVAKQMPGIKFLAVNVDKNSDVAQKYGIRGIPALVHLKNSKVKGTIVGSHPEQHVIKELKLFLDKK